MQRAEHSRTFRLIYGSPKPCNNHRGIIIRINSISRTICVSAFKHLLCSFTNMFAFITRLTCVMRFNYNKFNTIKQRFVFKFYSQIFKRPFSKSSFKLFKTSFICKSDTSQIFNSNTFPLLFSSKYDRLCNCMINYIGMSFLPSRKPFQQFFRTACAFGLNRTTNFLTFLSIFTKSVISMLNTIICFNYRGYPKINPYKFRNIFNISIWNINTLKQKEFTFPIKEVSLSLNILEILPIKNSKRYFLPTTNTPYRNDFFFVGKYPTIISNRPKRFKNMFNLPVSFISITNFCNSSYNYLSRKVGSIFNTMINKFVSLELIKNFILPSNVRYGIASLVYQFNSIKKQCFLLFSWVKFNLQCQNHITNIQLFFIFEKLFNFNLGVNYFPSTNGKHTHYFYVAIL